MRGGALRIGIDVDDVLYPFSERVHHYCEVAGLTNGKTITQWEFHNDYGIPRDRLWDFIKDLYRNGVLMEPPYPGVAFQAQRLTSAGHEVLIVTARGFEADIAPLVRRETERWLEFYEIPFDSLHFSRDKREVEADWFIDDSVGNVSKLLAAGTEARLRDQPHNQTSTLPRVFSLSEFVDDVLAAQLPSMV